MIEILHNSRCRKSREGLTYLNENYDGEINIREYLKNQLTAIEIKEIIEKLGIEVSDLLRKQEKDYKELIKGKNLSDSEMIQLMASHPKLIERPIVIKGESAVIGRPADKIKELL